MLWRGKRPRIELFVSNLWRRLNAEVIWNSSWIEKGEHIVLSCTKTSKRAEIKEPNESTAW